MPFARLRWMFTGAILLSLIAGLIIWQPISVQVSWNNGNTAQAAMPKNLPTTTPIPATATPLRPTATAIPPTTIPPTATAEPATSQPEPTNAPQRRRATPSPTAEATAALPDQSNKKPDIQINKAAEPSILHPGERVTFKLTVNNHGQATAHDVVVSDEIPRPLVVVDLHSSSGDIVVNGQRVTAYPRTLAPGESQVYTIIAQIPADTPAGPIDNTAVITTSDPDEPTNDNLSTTTITIVRDRTAFNIPARMPKTADPLDPTNQPLLAIYWPLLVLAIGLIGMGLLAKRGAFRQRMLQVTVGSTTPKAGITAYKSSVAIDPAALIADWRAGATTHELVEKVAQLNPQIDRLAVSIAVQKVLQSAFEQPSSN